MVINHLITGMILQVGPGLTEIFIFFLLLLGEMT